MWVIGIILTNLYLDLSRLKIFTHWHDIARCAVRTVVWSLADTALLHWSCTVTGPNTRACAAAVQCSGHWPTASFWASCCVFNWVDEMQSGWHDSCFFAVQCCQLFVFTSVVVPTEECDVEYNLSNSKVKDMKVTVNDQLHRVLILCTGFAIQLKRNRSITKTQTWSKQTNKNIKQTKWNETKIREQT